MRYPESGAGQTKLEEDYCDEQSNPCQHGIINDPKLMMMMMMMIGMMMMMMMMMMMYRETKMAYKREDLILPPKAHTHNENKTKQTKQKKQHNLKLPV